MRTFIFSIMLLFAAMGAFNLGWKAESEHKPNRALFKNYDLPAENCDCKNCNLKRALEQLAKKGFSFE